MKKSLVLMGLVIFGIGVSAAPVSMIPLNTTNIETINAALTQATASNETSMSIVIKLTVLKNIREKNITTFAALKTEINTVVDQFLAANKITAEEAANLKVYFTKQFALVSFLKSPNNVNIEMKQQGWEFCKQNPTNYDVSYLIYYKTFGLTDKEAYLAILDQFKKYNGTLINAKETDKVVTLFIKLAVTVDVKTQKEDLQTLNKIVSQKLLTNNKDQYMPIVAKIRTAIETY